MSAFLTLTEVAEHLGCSDESVRRAIHRGHLQAFRDGRLIRVSREHLDAYIAAHTTAPPARGRLRRTA